MFYLAALQAFNRANEFVKYGLEHSWAFIEEEHSLDPIQYLKTNPRDEFDRLKREYRDYKEHTKTPYHEGSYLLRIRMPELRGLMKIVASDYKPNLFEIVNMAVSAEMSGNKEFGDSGSKIMTFNKFKAIEYSNFESRILKFARKRFHKKMVKMYGENYYHVLIGIYYRDKNHPFHVLSDEFTLE
jgi:hypothetical protein